MGSIPETPWSVEDEDWSYGTTLYRLIDATGDPVLGVARHSEDEKPILETICMAVNAFAGQSPPDDAPDLLALLHDARVAMVLFGNEMNWPAETPPEYAAIINRIRAIDEDLAAQARGERR